MANEATNTSGNSSESGPTAGTNAVSTGQAPKADNKTKSTRGFSWSMSFSGKNILKILGIFLGLIVVGFFGASAYFYYVSDYSEPKDIRVTNITSGSATISWVTKEKTKGVVLYGEKDNFLPWIFTKVGKDMAYDDRDVAFAKLKTAEHMAENKEDDEMLEEEDIELVQEVVMKHMEKYYVHHVTIKGLDPEKKYYFLAGNGVRFAKVGDGFVDKDDEFTLSRKNEFKTYEELDEVPMPHPAYGKVETEDYEKVDDGGVFLRIMHKEKFTPLSAVLNDDGNWYIDLSAVRDEDTGESLADMAETIDAVERIFVEAGSKGDGSYETTLELDAPAPTIYVDGGDNNEESSRGKRTFSLISEVYAACPGGSVSSCTQSCKDGCVYSEYPGVCSDGCGNACRSECGEATGCSCGDCGSHRCENGKDQRCTESGWKDTADSCAPPPQEGGGGGGGEETREACTGGKYDTSPIAKHWPISGPDCPSDDSCDCVRTCKDGTKETCSAGGKCICPEDGATVGTCPSGTYARDDRAACVNDCTGTCVEDTAGVARCCSTTGVGYCPAGTYERDDRASCMSDCSGTCVADSAGVARCCSSGSATVGTCPSGTYARDDRAACTSDCSGTCVDDTAGVARCCKASSGTTPPTTGGGDHGKACISGGCLHKSLEGHFLTCQNGHCCYAVIEQGTSSGCESIVQNPPEAPPGQGSKGNHGQPCADPTSVSGVDIGDGCWGELTCSSGKCCHAWEYNDGGSCTRYAALDNCNPGNCSGNGTKCAVVGTTCKKDSFGICSCIRIKLGIDTSKRGDEEDRNFFERLLGKIFGPVKAADDPATEDYKIAAEGYVMTAEADGLYTVTIPGEGTAENVKFVEGATYSFYVDKNGNDQPDEGEYVNLSRISDLKVYKEKSISRYELSDGFNFVSFPLLPDETDSYEFIKMLNEEGKDKVTSIARFYSGSYQVTEYRDDTGAAGDQFPILPGWGYIIRVHGAREIEVEGKAVADSVEIVMPSAGWYLIGVHGASRDYTAEELIDSVDEVEGLDADNVTQWDIGKSRFEGLQKEPDEGGTEQVYGFDYPLYEKVGYFLRISEGSGSWKPD